MQIDPVDHPEPISESSLDCAATGQSEATTAEQAQLARVAFGMQNGEKRVQPNEMDRWLRLGNVKPREAALILCLHDPIHDCGKTPALFVIEIKARDFEWLLKAFEDVAATEKRTSSVRVRTLLDWRDFARDRKLKYHPYFDQFKQAPALIDEVKPPERPQTTAPSVSENSAAAVAVSAPSLTLNMSVVDLAQLVALAAEQRRITADNNGQVARGDKDATGAKATQPDAQSVCGAPEKYEQPAPSGTPKKPKRIRSTDNTALLNRCVTDGIAPHIADVWLHITSNAGKPGFPIATASKDSATKIDGKPVTKQQLTRALVTFRNNSLSTT